MMRSKLPSFSLRALTVAATLSSLIVPAVPVEASTILNEYTVGYYQDFATNSGTFSAGATNVEVYYKDGTSTGYTIPLMPNLSGYAAYYTDSLNFHGGSGLVSAQYVLSAEHCGVPDTSSFGQSFVNFYQGQHGKSVSYGINDYTDAVSTGATMPRDVMIMRLDKIVTETTYNPPVSDLDFIKSLVSDKTWLYRTGNGKYFQLNTSGKQDPVKDTRDIPFGGTVIARSISTNENGSVVVKFYFMENAPLNNAPESGDSGSPLYVFNEKTGQFETIGALSASHGGGMGKNGYTLAVHNTKEVPAFMADCDSTKISVENGGEKILWNVEGANFTRNGAELTKYYGSTYGNEAKGIVFSNTGTVVQEVQMQGSINMGYGSLTFEKGSFTLSANTESALSFNSAGFIVNDGASVITTFSGASGTEWRKVGEGILTIQGSGNHEIDLNVGGGVQRYELIKDEEGNITEYRQIRKGEVRLDRTGGYAAKTIKLSAGIASIVLMRDGQIKDASSFSFGVGGGLLNLNGQNLSWEKINHVDSGATIGNVKLADATTEAQKESTFTYTGTGTYLGGFTDGIGRGDGEGTGTLKVVYNNSAENASWTISGVSDNAGGFVVENGTLILQGTHTLHARGIDSGDYTYAVLESTGGVTVNNGATFKLGHHALMTGDVTVNNGVFEMNQTVGAEKESVGGGLRQDVTDLISLRGNVNLASTSSMMRVATDSVVAVNYGGVISGSGNFEKTGTGTLKLSGKNTFTGTKTVSGGTVEFASTDSLGGNLESVKWKIEKDGAIGVSGLGEEALKYVDATSTGSLALGKNTETQIGLTTGTTLSHDKLFVGAMSGQTIDYGTSGTQTELKANSENKWLLGGGGGTLNVHFKLTGGNSLIIGSENSSGTVRLTNTKNDFTGDIVIGGFNNFLTYDNISALGSGRISVAYGNEFNILDGTGEVLKAIKDSSSGILALRGTDEQESISNAIDLTQSAYASTAIGAVGEVRYTGTLTPKSDGNYSFGGSGTLILDTNLTGTGTLSVDAQGLSGGKIIFARESDFSGSVVVGGKLKEDSSLAIGKISLGFETENALAKASSVTLKNGAILELLSSDGRVNNLTTESGSSIVNNGAEVKTLTLNNSSDTTLAAGTLGGGTNRLNVAKEGSGTLTLGTNNNFQGTFTINEGKVVASSSSDVNSSFGIKESANRIIIGDKGTLQISLSGGFERSAFASSQIFHSVTGTGTLVLVGSGNMLALEQSESFSGTVRVSNGIRLLIGSKFVDNKNISHSNIQALNDARIVVESGAQARVTNRISNWGSYSVNAIQNSYSDYEISGNGMSWGGNAASLPVNANPTGALSVDCASVVHGKITLAGDASIASWSYNYGGGTATQAYGVGQWVGGTIRGAILGNHTLTLNGNQGLTFKADAESNYGALTLAQQWNGNSTHCPWALRVGLGEAKDTISTALGSGTVTINAGQSNNILTLRFDNAGTGGKEITYTYNNNFSVNNGKLESYYNTTNLKGTVTLTGTTLNLETKNGSLLRLEGGLVGTSGSVSITNASNIALGGNTTSGFGGTINAGAGTNLTLLASAAGDTALGSDVTLNFTDSLNLTLEGTNTFNFGSIVGSTSEGATGTSVKLTYDFTSGTAGSSLASTTFTVGNVSVYLNLNGTEDLQKGTYTLYTGDVNDTTFTLASTNLNGRVTLETKDNTVTLVVGDDVRLFRKYDASNKAWDKSSALWTSDTNKTVFSDNDSVVFGKDGVAENNSATSRETVSIASDVAVTSLAVKDGKYYSFDGSGKITASEKLNVYGASLELKNGANTFAAVTIGGDGGDSATAHGELVAAKTGVLTNSAISLGSNGTLTLSSAGTLAGTTKVSFDGGTLKYGSGNIGDISAFLVKGSGDANIDLNGQSVILGAPSAFSAGTMNFSNSSASSGTATLGSSSATFAVSEGSTINVGEKTTVKHYASGTLGKLSGSGTYEIDGSSALTLSAVSDFSGTLVKSGSGTTTISSDFTVENLSVKAGTFKLTNSGATSGRGKILKNVTLSGGVLQTHNGAQPTAATVIDKLTLAGASAELNTTNFQGYWQVKDLASSGSGVNGTLTLSSSHSATVRTIFELGDSGNLNAAQGDFTGSLSLKSTDSGTYRSSSLVISDANIAKNAKIDLSVCKSETGVLSLGVNANSVTIAGLSSTLGVAKAKIYSGKVGTQTTDGNGGSNGVTKTSYGDGTKRTLEINTAAGTNTSFNGEILANLSLVKTGAGTQTLAGASTTFDGGVSVQEGTLIAEHANALGIGAVSVKTGATLQANTAITFSTEAQTLTLFVGADDIESIVPVGEIQLRNGAGSSSQSLVTSGNGGSLTVSGASTVYIDVSALAGTTVTLPGNEFSLKLAAETALTFNDENARVGWWDESGTLWTDWALVSQYAYNADSGLMTLTIPEPSAFGSLVGLGALALVASRRRRSRRS